MRRISALPKTFSWQGTTVKVMVAYLPLSNSRSGLHSCRVVLVERIPQAEGALLLMQRPHRPRGRRGDTFLLCLRLICSAFLCARIVSLATLRCGIESVVSRACRASHGRTRAIDVIQDPEPEVCS